MPNISGKVIFNTPCDGNALDFRNGVVRNVPITLWNPFTHVGAIAFTDANGNYQFRNVPNGSYLIAESSVSSAPQNSIVDFSTASVIPAPIPGDPDIASATVATDGTRLNSLSPNSFIITISGDLTDINFLDAPVRDLPFPPQNIIESGNNLITLADNGTFGAISPGSIPETSPPTSPYPNIMPQNPPSYVYQQYLPNNGGIAVGHYSVTNVITNSYVAWWGVADHTTGNETGRMLVVTGEDPNRVFFTQTVSVKPNTNYFFSTWVLNLTRDRFLTTPKLEFAIQDNTGSQIFSQTIQAEIDPGTVPTWFQVARLINSGNASSLTLIFTFRGVRRVGEDFLIDDISLREAILTPRVSYTKSVDKGLANIGDILTYTLTIRNDGPERIDQIFYSDTIPENTTFIPGSVIINNANYPDPIPPTNVNAYTNFILSGTSQTLSYKVKISDTIPNLDMITNQGYVGFQFVNNLGIAENRGINSNVVFTKITNSLLIVTKDVDKIYANIGDYLHYTITIYNQSSITANNLILLECLPYELCFIQNSLVVNNHRICGCPNLTYYTLGDLQPHQSISVSFDAKINSSPCSGQIINFCKVAHTYTQNILQPNTIQAQIDSNITTTQILPSSECNYCKSLNNYSSKCNCSSTCNSCTSCNSVQKDVSNHNNCYYKIVNVREEIF